MTASKQLVVTARKALLRRGRAILRLQEDYPQVAANAAENASGPDYLTGLSGAERRELDQIHSALHRIDRGVFGLCERCAAPIDGIELESTPWRHDCSRCSSATAPWM